MKFSSRDAVFALRFSDEAPAITCNVVAVSWTIEVLRVLREIRDEAIKQARLADERAFVHLPYANLRAFLQLEVADWATLKDDIGLRSLPEKARDADPWGFLSGGDPKENLRKIKDAFAQWSEGALARFSESRSAHAIGIVTLRQLALQNKLLRVTPSRVQLFPWGTSTKTGLPSPFDVTAGVLAAQLAGKEIFPGLGPVTRVVGGPVNNHAEIMTRPHNAAGGRFSLVCALSIETLPGGAKPLIYLRFSRRRWADSLNNKYPSSSTIGGFVFPHAERPASAFRFSVIHQSGKWITDMGYPHYEHALKLSRGFQDEEVLEYPCDDHASVLVMVKADVADARKSDLQAGVPLVDQADAFIEVVKALQPLGFEPFEAFRAVKYPALKARRLSMLKAEVTLARVLERYGPAGGDEAPLGVSIQVATDAPSTRWFKAEIPVPDPQHNRVVTAIRTLVKDTAYLADATRQTIYVVAHAPDDLEWIRTTISAMLGDSIKVVSAALPAGTHGPKQSLALDGKPNKVRFDARVQAWLKFVESAGIPQRAMVLIVAPIFFDVGEGKVKPDDRVNKPAARQALASAGCTVQYLLPSETGRLVKFLPRLQAAILDLVFGHAGSVWGLQQASSTCFPTVTTAPRWVSAISSLQVHTDWDTVNRVFVATRLECASGQAWVRFAHQDAEIVQTPWMRFDEGAKYLAGRRLVLPRLHGDQRDLLAKFFETTLDQVAADDPNAVVFIDSTRIARLARWLSDQGVNEARGEVSPGLVAGVRWPSLRLLRVREQAPAIGQEKIYAQQLPNDPTVRTWTSTANLFQVDTASMPTFWSLAKPTSHHKRGASCYRETTLPNSKVSPEHPNWFRVFSALPDYQHMTPRAVELVVLQKQATDADVQLASFAQHLRAGMLTAFNERWVTTPSPLRIIDKLAEYMRS